MFGEELSEEFGKQFGQIMSSLQGQAEAVATQAVTVGAATVKAMAGTDAEFYQNYARIVARAVKALEEEGFSREEAIDIAKGLNIK